MRSTAIPDTVESSPEKAQSQQMFLVAPPELLLCGGEIRNQAKSNYTAE
jgi:hypothetical protein